MKIQTKYVGEITIDESTIIKFSKGIPGFLNETEFVLLELPGNPLFHILQSIQTRDIAFILTDPYHFYRNYSFELDDNTIETLAIKSENDVLVLSVVTLQQPFANSTINLKAPIIINPNSKYGKQYILNIDEYPSKASILTEEKTELKGE